MPTTTTAVEEEEEEEEEGTNERTVKKNQRPEEGKWRRQKKGKEKHPGAAEEPSYTTKETRGPPSTQAARPGDWGIILSVIARSNLLELARSPYTSCAGVCHLENRFSVARFAVLDPETPTFFQFENHLLFPRPAARQEIQ